MNQKLKLIAIPSLIVALGGAAGVLSNIAIGWATVSGLPPRVEAGEVKNAEQDLLLERLTTLQEFYLQERQQQQQVQQQRSPQQMVFPGTPQQQMTVPPIERWQDGYGDWWCCDPYYDYCEDPDAWYSCSPPRGRR